jgi:uncharacterized protein YgbK (DUF1537 family)
MRRIAIIADDLTGASDAGVQLARRGLHTIVTLEPHQPNEPPDCDVLVVDTDSRAHSGPDAYAVVARAVRAVGAAGFHVAYKKIDSTLRGNIGAELDAVMDTAGFPVAALAPAFPATGRTTVDGLHLLHGVPVAETEVGRDHRGSVRESDILRLLGGQSRRTAARIELATVRAGTDATFAAAKTLYERGAAILVFDAVTDEDLHTIALALARSTRRILWAGSAGFAVHLPGALDLPKTARQSPAFAPVDRPVLIVAGTASHVTRAQVARLAQLPEIAIIAVDPAALASGQETARLATELVHELAADRTTVLTLSDGPEVAARRAPTLAAQIADALGALAASALDTGLPKAVILTGGDTARAVCRHLGATGIRLLDEFEPGVPVGRLVGAASLLTATKAGAFGTPDTLVKALGILRGTSAMRPPLTPPIEGGQG